MSGIQRLNAQDAVAHSSGAFVVSELAIVMDMIAHQEDGYHIKNR
ncbi:hypothetical protein [Yaniella halotolerans]|nr:hypothetical protein [Yaniella halotolerans]